MAERTSYLAGTPSWVDIGVPDTAAAAEFYGGLFGWTLQDMGPDAGGYGMFQLRGLDVAGVGPQQMPDAPPFWTVYECAPAGALALERAEQSERPGWAEKFRTMMARRKAQAKEKDGK